MFIFKVTLSFMLDHMQYMHERAAFAMTPGQALDDVVTALRIQRHRTDGFKSFVSQPNSLEEFGRDTMIMPVTGSDLHLKDLWVRKHGDAI